MRYNEAMIDSENKITKTLKGEVVNVMRFDSGYAIVTLETSKKGNVRVVGDLANLTNGAQVTFEVEEVTHPKYGKQFKSLSYTENGFSTLEGVSNYISHLFYNVGSVTANLIVNHFGAKTIEVLDENSKKVYEVPNIQKNRADEIANNWLEKRSENQILGKIMSYGFSAVIAKRIIEKFTDPVDIIENHPYDLVKVRMLSFERIDKFALSKGVKRNSYERIGAAIDFVLDAASKQGNCYMMQDQLAEDVVKLLDNDIVLSEFSVALTKGIDKGDFVFEKYRIFLAELYYAEKTIAERIFQNDHYHNVPLVGTLEEFKQDLVKYNLVDDGIVFAEEQLQALYEAMVGRVKIIRGGPGTGKALENSTPIPTPNGFKFMGDLKVNDLVIGKNGLPTRVNGVFPQGEQSIYKITFNDKTSINTTKDHLWGIKNKSDRRKGCYDKVLTTEQIAINLTKGDRLRRMSVPLVSPVDFDGEEPIIDPYLLGTLLGDGGLTQLTPKFSNKNEELLNNVLKALPESVRMIHIENGDYRLSCENGRWNGNPLTQILKELNCMNCNAHAKFIPQNALWSNANYRWSILQGLMDTDGTWDRTTCTFSTVSTQLAQDVLFILRSWGLKATLNVKNGTYKGQQHTSWRICFNTPVYLPPFRINEKLSKWKPLKKYRPSKIIRSVEELQEKKHCTCISVDAEDNLFCANDFIVTHNTTITKTLCRAFEHYGVSFKLCSPTGKAAKRLRAGSGYPASTIHRLLGYDKGGGAQFNKFCPLDTQCLIIDESSMIDVVLASKLLDAIQTNTRIIFIGDADQLPPVGPGNVFKDLIEGGLMSTTKLEHIFRQQAGSSIIGVAHDIIHGKIPNMPSPKESKGQNCIFVSVADMELFKQYLITMVTVQIPKLGIASSDIQVLTPMRAKGLGVEDLNPILQEALNPPSANKAEFKSDFKVFRVGDRVMQIRNDYNKEIFNGDTGNITEISKVGDGAIIKVTYPDMVHPVTYEKGEVSDIVHCYATTVHKCIKKGELVLSHEGYKCEDKMKIGDNVSVGGNEFRQIKDIIDSGLQDVHRVTTKTGFELEATERHPLLVFDASKNCNTFKLIKDIKEDDCVIIDRSLCVGKNELGDIAWVLGLIVGDGHYSKDNNDYRIEVSGHVDSIDSLQYFSNIIKDKFKYDVKIYPKNKTRNDFKNVRYCIFSKEIREYFKSLGLEYVTCDSKRVPECIWSGNENTKYNFIAGLIDADGCVDKQGVRIVIKSSVLAKEVQLLLLNLGIVSTKRKDYPDAFCVHISGPSVHLLNKNIRLINKSKAMKLNFLKNKSGKTNNDIIPHANVVEEFLKVAPKFRGEKGKGLNSPKYKSFSKQIRGLKNGVKITYNHINHMINYLVDNNIEVPQAIIDINESNYYYDKIKSISPCGEAETFDYEIDGVHSFVSNGFVCHNSQGSEYPAVVMILHPSQSNMLQRNLFYTGITRAKQLCIVMGTQGAIDYAVGNDKQQKRNTNLNTLMREMYSEIPVFANMPFKN